MAEVFYINGIGAPKIDVYEGGTFVNGVIVGATLRDSLTMPTTTVEGQPESYSAIEDEQELESDEVVKRFLGYRFRMFMYYNDLMRGSDVLAYITKLYNYRAKGYTFEVFPNVDNLNRKMYMYLVSDFEFKTNRYAVDADGLENIVLEWESRFTYQEIQMYDPLDIWVPFEDLIAI